MKITVLLSMFLLFNATLFSQSKFKPQIRIGLNSTDIDNFNAKNDYGYYIGVAYPVKVGKNKTMRVELTYDKQNTKLIENTQNLHFDGCFNENNTDCFLKNIKMEFITASFVYDYFFNDDIYVLISPFISVITSQNFNQYQPGFINIMPLYDYGIVAGLGYKFMPQLRGEFRFKKGFEDVVLLPNNVVNRTNTFQLGLIYSFKK